MNQQMRKDSTNSAEREHGSAFENIGEKDSGKSLFQFALKVEDLLKERRIALRCRETRTHGTAAMHRPDRVVGVLPQCNLYLSGQKF
jgi:hypothetical protein